MIHVIIPVYNRINFTINCLRSLKKQINYKQLNIIVVDDGSTDDTLKILKKDFSEIKILKGTGSLYWCGAISLGIKLPSKIFSLSSPAFAKIMPSNIPSFNF